MEFIYFIVAVCIFLIGYPLSLILAKRIPSFKWWMPDDNFEVVLSGCVFMIIAGLWFLTIPAVLLFAFCYSCKYFINNEQDKSKGLSS